jgi:hypothetical protein
LLFLIPPHTNPNRAQDMDMRVTWGTTQAPVQDLVVRFLILTKNSVFHVQICLVDDPIIHVKVGGKEKKRKDIAGKLGREMHDRRDE